MLRVIIKVKYLIPIVFVIFCVKYMLRIDCYWNTDCKYKYFSSKTPYEIIRGDISDSVVNPKGCEAVSVWAIMRHGKRNPTPKFGQGINDILKSRDFIISSYEIGNSSLCAQDIENIKNWKADKAMLEKPDILSAEGYKEMLHFGNRLKKTFPKLLNNLQEKEYLFFPGFGHHQKESAKAFVKGLNFSILAIDNDTNDDEIVAPYSTCGKYYTEVRRNPDVYHEEMEFKKTVDYLNMKKRIETKLGLSFTLSDDNITAIYDLCRYSWNGITNTPCPWCAIFSDEDLQVLEYIGDLRHYYRNGYGIAQYGKLFGQMLLSDSWTNFEQVKNGKGKKIVSYFTHATMMDMIAVAMNLFKDTNPLMGAYRDVNRKWRTTFISTFASNMIAVLNRCNQYEEGNYDYKVAFYWNEKPLLDLCNDGVCSWQEFEDIFKTFLDAKDRVTDVCEFKWTALD